MWYTTNTPPRPTVSNHVHPSKEEALLNRFRSIVLAAVFAGLVLVSTASAQNISVVSGNGQVLSISNVALAPLTVKVTDANGNPLPGQTVNWNALNYYGLYPFFTLDNAANQFTNTTDSTGQATAVGYLTASTFPGVNAFTQVTVSATVNSGNGVNFTLTQLVSSPEGSPSQIQAGLVDPSFNTTTFIGDTFSGAVGTTSSHTIQIHVAATNRLSTNAIPFAAVQLLNYQDPAKGPAAACVQTDPSAGFGTVLTDTNGNATCTVAFSGQPGNGQFVVAVGGVRSATVIPPNFGFWQFSPTDPNNPTPIQSSYTTQYLNETVTPGAAGSIKITQGNGQSANPGHTLSTPLQVEVDSTTGQPLSGQTVNWTVTPTNATNNTIPSSTTDSTGRASTSVTLSGGSSGTVIITAAVAGSASLSQSFSITVVPLTPPVTITNFSVVSGGSQSASVNTAFPQPLVVGVTTSAGSPAGITVQFSSSGPVSLSATTATTDSNGRAQVSVTALNVTGSASVTATIAGYGSQTFSLTVTPPAPIITAGNFVNGADLQANSLSPCSIGALVTAAGALGVSGVGPTFPGLPVASSNVSITFNNIAAPILNIGTNSAGQQQITFQVPCSVTPGSSVPASVTVGAGSTPVNVAVGAASPGIFQTQMSDGVFRAVVVRPDGSYVSLQNPARRGETEIAYVTGLGATAPPVGTLAVPVPGTTAAVQGAIVPGMAGQGVPLVYAQLSEDLPGVYVVAFQIPSGMTTGNNVGLSIGIQVGGTTVYSGLSKIPVQ